MCVDVFFNFLCVLLWEEKHRWKYNPAKQKKREKGCELTHALHDPLRFPFRWELAILCHIWSRKVGSRKIQCVSETSDKKTQKMCVCENIIKETTVYRYNFTLENSIVKSSWLSFNRSVFLNTRFTWRIALDAIRHRGEDIYEGHTFKELMTQLGQKDDTQKDDSSKKNNTNDQEVAETITAVHWGAPLSQGGQ